MVRVNSAENIQEAQNKLKLLIEKAQKQKIDLWEISAIRQQKKFFEVKKKIKIFTVFLVLLVFYGKFNNLLTSDKVDLIHSKVYFR